MNQPLVSCIMPTANRERYAPFAIKDFLQQDYPHTELIIIDDGKESIAPIVPEDPRIKYYYSSQKATVGAKRNQAIEKANGEIIMHWDDDDWHASDWVSKQAYSLITSGADICGIEHVHFYSTVTDTLWKGTALNRNNPNIKGWLNGATFAYYKSFWKKHPFKDLPAGEDDDLLRTSGARLFAHDYIDGFISILHAKNTTPKYFEKQIHKSNPF